MTFVGSRLAAFLERLRAGSFAGAKAEISESARVCRLERDLAGAARARRAVHQALDNAAPNAGED